MKLIIVFLLISIVSGSRESQRNVSEKASSHEDTSRKNHLDCSSYCDEMFAESLTKNENWFACHRGCRYFTLLQVLKGEKREELIRASCHTACTEAYNTTESLEQSCQLGCNNQDSLVIKTKKAPTQLNHRSLSSFLPQLPFSYKISWTKSSIVEQGSEKSSATFDPIVLLKHSWSRFLANQYPSHSLFPFLKKERSDPREKSGLKEKVDPEEKLEPKEELEPKEKVNPEERLEPKEKVNPEEKLEPKEEQSRNETKSVERDETTTKSFPVEMPTRIGQNHKITPSPSVQELLKELAPKDDYNKTVDCIIRSSIWPSFYIQASMLNLTELCPKPSKFVQVTAIATVVILILITIVAFIQLACPLYYLTRSGRESDWLGWRDEDSDDEQSSLSGIFSFNHSTEKLITSTENVTPPSYEEALKMLPTWNGTDEKLQTNYTGHDMVV